MKPVDEEILERKNLLEKPAAVDLPNQPIREKETSTKTEDNEGK